MQNYSIVFFALLISLASYLDSSSQSLNQFENPNSSATFEDSLKRANKFFVQANYVEALKLYLLILESAKNNHQDSLLASLNFTVGRAHYYFRNERSNEACLPFMNEALRLSELHNDKQTKFKVQWALGAILGEMELYDSSYALLEAARSFALSQSNYAAVSTIDFIQVDYLMKQTNNQINAYDRLEQGLRFAVRANDVNTRAYARQKTGSYLILKKRFSEAEMNLLIAEDLYESIESKNGLLNVYFELINLYSNTKQFEKLSEAYKKRMELNNEVYNHKLTESLAQMQVKYEADKKEKDNLLLKANNEKQLEVIKRKEEEQNFQTALMAILGIAFLGIIVIFYYRNKSKQNELLSNQQRLKFKAVIEAEEKERKRIASDLHDGLGQLLSVAKINVSSIEEVGDNHELLENSLNILDKAVQEVRTISHNMMPNALVSLGLMAAIREELNQIEALNQYEIKTDLINVIDVDESMAIALYRIIQEGLNNIIKYAKANKIDFIMQIENSTLLVQIKDNGIGFNQSSLKDSNRGIGLKTMKSRMDLIGGKIEIKSSNGKGTSISLKVPLN